MQRTTRRGFTLLELIIVSMMLTALFAAIFGVMNNTLRWLNEVTIAVKQGREGPAVLALIQSDLANAYIDARMEHMFEGDMREGSEMRFVTSRNSILFLDGVQSDLTEVGYRIERNELVGTRELFTLYRREDFSMDDEPLKGGKWIPVTNNIVRFECTFYSLFEDEGGNNRGGLSGMARNVAGSVAGAIGAATGSGQPDEPMLAELRLGEGISEENTVWDRGGRYLPYAVKILLQLDIREGEARLDRNTENEGIQTFVSIVRLPPFPRNLEKIEDNVTLQLNPPPGAPNPPNQNQNNQNQNAQK